MPYRYPSEPLALMLAGARLRTAILFALTLLFAVAVLGIGAVHANTPRGNASLAKSLTCMPPVTGTASSRDGERARSKATYAWLARVENRYGRDFVDVNLTRDASWHCGLTGDDVTCRVAAQPCRLVM